MVQLNPENRYAGGAQAQIVQSQPAAQAQPAALNALIVQHRQPPPPGRWADNICDWPTNLFPSCWCAYCCCQGMYIVAQSKFRCYSFNRNIIISCM